MNNGSRQIEYRDIGSLRENPLNPRGPIDVADISIRELADSIRSCGLIQPILITPDGVIVAGHRRYAACRHLGLKKIATIIQNLNEQQQFEIMLVENIQRQNLNPVQEAKAFQHLIEKGFTSKAVAEKVGLPFLRVEKILKINAMPSDLQELIASGELPLGAVPHLYELKDNTKQVEIGKRAASEQWAIWQVSSAVHQVKSGKTNIKQITFNEISSPERPANQIDKRQRQYALSSSIDALAAIREKLSRHSGTEKICKDIESAEEGLVDLSMKDAKARRSRGES